MLSFIDIAYTGRSVGAQFYSVSETRQRGALIREGRVKKRERKPVTKIFNKGK